MAVSAESICSDSFGKGRSGALEQENLIKELRQGSTSAFSSFIDKYTPYVSTVIFRITVVIFSPVKNMHKSLSEKQAKSVIIYLALIPEAVFFDYFGDLFTFLMLALSNCCSQPPKFET